LVFLGFLGSVTLAQEEVEEDPTRVDLIEVQDKLIKERQLMDQKERDQDNQKFEKAPPSEKEVKEPVTRNQKLRKKRLKKRAEKD